MAVKQRGLTFQEADEFRNIGELIDFLLLWNESFDEINNRNRDSSYNPNGTRTSRARLATDEDWDKVFPL